MPSIETAASFDIPNIIKLSGRIKTYFFQILFCVFLPIFLAVTISFTVHFAIHGKAHITNVLTLIGAIPMVLAHISTKFAIVVFFLNQSHSTIGIANLQTCRITA